LQEKPYTTAPVLKCDRYQRADEWTERCHDQPGTDIIEPIRRIQPTTPDQFERPRPPERY
jgi:hypothetical protein